MYVRCDYYSCVGCDKLFSMSVFMAAANMAAFKLTA